MPVDLNYLQIKLKHNEPIDHWFETLWLNIRCLPRQQKIEMLERIAVDLGLNYEDLGGKE